jgi:repressor LexA
MARPFTTQLTDRQQQVLDWVCRFAEEHKMPPTVREIGAAFKITPRAVSDFLKALERKGYLKRGNLGARSIEFPERKRRLYGESEIRILGRIAAGKPIYAHEDDLGTLSLNPLMQQGCFALVAEGDSMIDAGILSGDYVLVRPQEHARDGDMVVALVNDEEATVKYFYRETDRIRLQPANKSMAPIYIRPDELRIQGRVVGMQRHYESLRGGSHV